jgi:hypothetical protein
VSRTAWVTALLTADSLPEYSFSGDAMIITAISIPLFLLALWIMSGYLPTRNIAMPNYSVAATKSEYEIRHYDPYIIAETSIGSEPGSSGFKELFQYISGNNTGRSKLTMTAPVLKSADGGGQKLAMTAPVLKQNSAGSGTISFLMPPGSRLEELPKPKSPKITLREIPGHKVAVVRFSGVADAGTVKGKTEHLLGLLRQDGVKIRSTPITALYNPPWTPPFMRRNEIMVEIE